MTENQQSSTQPPAQQQQQAQQQQPPTSAGSQSQQVQRQMSQPTAQNQPQQQVVSQPQPQPIQPQPQQSIQPQPAQPQNIQPQQQQQQNVQQQQQTIQQLPQLQQIAPQQQQQHLLPNLQNMTSVPISMTMGTNPMNMTSNNLRPQLNQIPQVQVIHQAMQSPSFMPQFATYNQQLMLQNMQAAMQANVVSMNHQQLNMANMVAMQQQGRSNNMFTPGAPQTPTTPTTPNIMNISSGGTTQVTSTSSASTNSVKPAISNKQIQSQPQQQQQQSQQQQQNIQQQNIQQQGQAQNQQQQQQQIHTLGQATAMIGGKPIILGQPGSLLQGQIGVISAGQLQTTQAYASGPTFGQIQSKQGQQISMTGQQGQGQVQLNSSQQSAMRFSQPQLIVSNAGNAQLISPQPVFTNQMLQAMASQLQHYPQQPIMSGQGQTIISGQGLYIRSANPIQTPGIVTGVQNAMNSNFKNPNQQTIQTVAVPIQKQTTAAQTGKVLLPSVSKPATAKVPPNSMSGTAKSTTQTVMKTKGRPKGSGKSSPAVTSAATNAVKSESLQSPTCKSPIPTNTVTALGSPDLKSQSDSELERKSISNEPQSDEVNTIANVKNSTKPPEETLTKEIAIVEAESKPVLIPDHPVEKQRAIVKPHILTHVIEGFVIQEGPEPFPVQRSSLLTEFIPPKPGQPVEQSSLISIDEQDMEEETDTSHDEQGPLSGRLRCEFCNNVYTSHNSAQRFCSKSCAKRYNVGCTKRLHHFPGRPKEKGVRGMKRKRKGKKGWHGNRLQSSSSVGGVDVDMEEQSSSISQDDTHSPSTSPDHHRQTPPPELQIEGEYIPPVTSPTKWNVTEVYEFIKNLPGCSIYADEFKSQEIDGQALLLLKEDHLMTTMNMKLGPALKICARINSIKEETG